jgi:hypothetical protein
MRMNATLGTWRLFVEECRTLRQIERNSTVARVFYQASLYARVFHAWVGVFNRILKGRIIAHNQYMAKRRAVCGRVFAAWSRYAFTKRLREYRYIRDAHDRRVAQMLQKVILAWRNQTLNSRHREFLVEQLVSTNLQRQFFSQWVYEHFVLKLFCVTRAKHNLYEYKKSVRTVFVRWRLALLGRMRIKAGAARMKQAVERFQLRAAFAKWPGRQSFALSEELRARLLRKGRGKARLVQCTLGRNCKPVECSDSESDNDHMDALSSVHDMMLKHKLGHGFSRRHRRRDNKGKATKSAGSKKLRHGVDGTTTEESSPTARLSQYSTSGSLSAVPYWTGVLHGPIRRCLCGVCWLVEIPLLQTSTLVERLYSSTAPLSTIYPRSGSWHHRKKFKLFGVRRHLFQRPHQSTKLAQN